MHDIVFLFDVDNTLLDNDMVQEDLSDHLTRAYGVATRDRYWALFDRLEDLHDPRVLRIANWLVDYPFPERLYPGALAAVRRVQSWGPAVILSDGDAVFQPRKVERSGLWHVFGDDVLIYVHKEQALDDVERLYPARHYVMIDDKLRILQALKQAWGERVTTVFPRQGHYALDPAQLAAYPPAEITLPGIGDLLGLERDQFRG